MSTFNFAKLLLVASDAKFLIEALRKYYDLNISAGTFSHKQYIMSYDRKTNYLETMILK